jgi:acetyl-CoA carboxylase biotin carboxylase subunit
MAKFQKILIANRGEIAVRIIRTCRELGIATCAVYSDADRAALFVRWADDAFHIGRAPSRESYLVKEKILDVARRAGVDAIHPGYGFLSENADFARACQAAGIAFIGPPAEAMEAMGEKTRARAHMVKAQVPVVPGSTEPFASAEEAKAFANRIGFPVMLKAAGGGGGKGMRRVDAEAAFDSAFRAAKSEAKNAFGNDAVYLEKYLEKPRHIEIQVFADAFGNCIHLGERECSVQRRHQKVVEESPSPLLDEEMRQKMGEIAVRAARSVGYVGAGTVEFLVDAHRQFYFLEMNTRLQVEHPVTEWTRGLDLVAWQIRVAEGEKLPLPVAPPLSGHSLEARIYAENPQTGFLPSPGKILSLTTPSGPFVRDDSGVYADWTVPNEYDPLLSKLSVWAPTRAEAIARMQRALSEYSVGGIATNIRYLKAVLAHAEFASGDYDAGFLPRRHEELLGSATARSARAAVWAAAIFAQRQMSRSASAPAAPALNGPSAWRLALRRTGRA